MDAWEQYLVVDLDERRAAELAVRRVLKGFDAVHLAAALTLRDAVGDDGVAFSSFDAPLNEAAAAEGLIGLSWAEPGPGSADASHVGAAGAGHTGSRYISGAVSAAPSCVA